MPCYRPLNAFQTQDGAVVFSELRKYNISRSLQLACGQCIGCRLERSRQWAIRCVHEARQHEENSLLTLTYDPEHIPEGGTLRHRDIQLFIKRLRKSLLPRSALPAPAAPPLSRKKIRYYMCGEYGANTRRPHYHMCLFGHDFNDKTYLTTTSAGSKIYTSQKLNALWKKGNATIGEITFESAAYVARYIMKKVNGQAAKQHYQQVDNQTGEIHQLTPEYTKMSLKPGIGATWLSQWKKDAYPDGQVWMRGHRTKTPKYYDKIYKRENPLDYEELLYQRGLEAAKYNHDNTKERLAVKETVKKAQIKFLKRHTENP